MAGFLVGLGLAFALVLGSWMALRPSGESRRLAGLRQEAIARGLRIRRVSSGERNEIGGVLPDCVVWYRLPTNCALPEALAVRREGRWYWIKGCEAYTGRLTIDDLNLPSGVQALRISREGIDALWDEADGLSLEQLSSSLRSLETELKKAC